MFLEIPRTEFDRRTRIPANGHQANIFDEIAPINGPQTGALSVHLDGLVHVMAPEKHQLVHDPLSGFAELR